MKKADDMEPTTFGALLKRYRMAAGLTQEALAARANLSTRAISDLERGLSRAPRYDTLLSRCWQRRTSWPTC